MPTVDKTFAFAADAEGFVESGLNATLGFSWESADGDPANGCVKFSGTGFGLGGGVIEEVAQTPTGVTWENWGVPPGNLVTAWEITDIRYKLAAYNGNLHGSGAEYCVTDASGYPSFSPPRLFTDHPPPADGWLASGAAFGSRAVSGAFSASTAEVRLWIRSYTGSTFVAPTWDSDFRIDSITIRITYTAGDTVYHARGPDGRLFQAVGLAGVLNLSRYNDAWPDIFAAATAVEAGDVNSCCLSVRRSGILDLTYTHTGGAVKYRASRNQGVTFTVATTIAASGYDVVAHDMGEADGLFVAMIRKTSDGFWYVTVGTLGDDGATWTFSTPVAVVAGKPAGASLRRMAAGIWEFSYINTSGGATIRRCRALAADGTGTWS